MRTQSEHYEIGRRSLSEHIPSCRRGVQINRHHVQRYDRRQYVGFSTDYLISSFTILFRRSMQLVAKPGQFDVMVMPNLYGAITSNIGAALVGGPGIVPGCNIGREYALFEPGCRHVAKDIMGTNKANPAAMILSSTMMLRHLG